MHYVDLRFAASQTLGLFLALPMVKPVLFAATNKSALSDFAKKLYELVQVVFSAAFDEQDLSRAEFLSFELLKAVPTVFADFGDKPKFHYALGHIAETLRRHGPSPFWSSFALESRLGDLKRACLLVANNKGVAERGGNLTMEMFCLRRRASRFSRTAVPLSVWLMEHCGSTVADTFGEETGLRQLQHQPVYDMTRFEGTFSAFERGSFISFHRCPLWTAKPSLVYVVRMSKLGLSGSVIAVVKYYDLDLSTDGGILSPLYAETERLHALTIKEDCVVSVCRTLQLSVGTKNFVSCLYC